MELRTLKDHNLRNEGPALYYGLMGLDLCNTDLGEYLNKERDYIKSKLEAGVVKMIREMNKEQKGSN